MGKWIEVHKGGGLYVTVFSGNVTFFEPGEGQGTSIIHLVDGLPLPIREGYETLKEKFMSQ